MAKRKPKQQGKIDGLSYTRKGKVLTFGPEALEKWGILWSINRSLHVFGMNLKIKVAKDGTVKVALEMCPSFDRPAVWIKEADSIKSNTKYARLRHTILHDIDMLMR